MSCLSRLCALLSLCSALLLLSLVMRGVYSAPYMSCSIPPLLFWCPGSGVLLPCHFLPLHRVLYMPLIFGVFIPPLFLVLILGYAPDLVFLTLILSCFCPENRAFISRFDFGHYFFKSHFEIPTRFWDARFQNPAYFFRFFFLNLDLGFPPPFWFFDPPLDFSALRLFSSVVMYQSI